MKVLHVAGAFAAHPLYVQLVAHLRRHCAFQMVFAPVRSATELAKRPPDVPGELEFLYRRILKPHHRLMFRAKVRRILAELRACVDPSRFDVMHAHTLYSDGAVALRVKRDCGVPFIVAVRNTDLNFFMPLRRDLRAIRQAVLREASRVIFLSPAYRSQLLERLGGEFRDRIDEKSVVIPNGVGPLWLEPWEPPSRANGTPLRLLYVGDFSSNKNVPGILRAAAILNARSPVELTLVGSAGRDERRIRRSVEGGEYPFARLLGRIEDAHALREVYRRHDIFMMPSFRETFGIVYIEALSQGLPVVYTRGQGIDGLFEPGTVGEAVDPGDIQHIAGAVLALSSRRESVRSACIAQAQRFSWSQVAQSYDDVYRSVARV